MTARPEFGAAIAVEGSKPTWLPDDVVIDYRVNGPWLYDRFGEGIHSAAFVYYTVTAIRLEVPRYDFVYLALERGMVPWFGGDEAPGDIDWDGRILLRDGRIFGSASNLLRWSDTSNNADIIGYTRKATSTALPLAHPAAPQGGDTVREALRRMIYEATHLSPCKTNGDHDCTIKAETLAYARTALAHTTYSDSREEIERVASAIYVSCDRLDDYPTNRIWSDCNDSTKDNFRHYARAALAALAPAAIASGREGAE